MKFVRVVKAEEANENYMSDKLGEKLIKDVDRYFNNINEAFIELEKLIHKLEEAKDKKYLPENSVIPDKVQNIIVDLEERCDLANEQISKLLGYVIVKPTYQYFDK